MGGKKTHKAGAGSDCLRLCGVLGGAYGSGIRDVWTKEMGGMEGSGGRKTEEGRRKKEEGRRKTEEGGRKKEGGRRKEEEGRREKKEERKWEARKRGKETGYKKMDLERFECGKTGMEEVEMGVIEKKGLEKKNSPILELTDLTYGYGDGTMAIDHVSLKVYSNERIAVIGANGAGKSTCFLCINGVLRPDQGTVSFQGEVIGKRDWKELRKHVGIVFQDADSQIVASTVYSEVSFGPMNLKCSREEVRERTDKALAYMNLEELKNRAPHDLSGGEKKRVSIGDIIAMEPEIIIFDEPATGLDPLNQQILEDVLERIWAEGKTVILSTHDMDFAYRFADRVVVFGDKRILADGSPHAIFSDKNLLDGANLKSPVILEIYNLLKSKGLAGSMDGRCPRTVEELSGLIGQI